MKSKLYRVLVLLVAIAMMIPSFALAADPAPAETKTPTFTLTGADKPIEVKMGENIDTSGITWEVKDLPTGIALQNAKILWTVTSDNNSTFSLYPTENILTADMSGQPVPTVYNSNFKKNKEDVTDSTATVTGKLVVNSKDIASKSFTVKVSKVDVTSIDFNDTAKQTKTTASAGTQVDLSATGNITLVAPDNASFGINDVVYRVVSGGDYARITSGGTLYIDSNTPSDTKIKVRAYIPGSNVASYEKSKAEIEITVVGQYKPDDPQDAAKDAYTFIGFTVNKDTGNVYTIHSNTEFSFNDYLTTLGNKNGLGTDKLVWQVNDPTKAILDQEVTDDADNTLTFKKTNVAANVKVTVKSKNDPTVTDYCYVQFVPAEKKEDKGYTNVKFAPYNSKTVVEGNDGDVLDLYEYLVFDLDGTSDSLLWSDDKGLIVHASMPYISPDDLKVENSPITVTVRSKQNANETDNFTITVVKADADPGYTKVEFVEKELTVEKNTDILPYLTLEGDTGKPSDLIFTSSDESIANVTPFIVNEHFLGLPVTFTSNAKDGDKVTISVRNTRSSKTVEPSTITLTYSKKIVNPEYKIGFTQESIDVRKSQCPFDLSKYVYVQDKDGNKVDNTTAQNVINALLWNSENENIATVNNGVVFFVKEGPATITIRTDYSVKTPSAITVNMKKDPVEDTIKDIAFTNKDTITIVKDNTFNAYEFLSFTDIEGAIIPASSVPAVLAGVKWTSTDTTVASVNAGVVTGLKEGTATINVRYNKASEKQTASLKVEVVKAAKNLYTKVKFAEPTTMDAHIDKNNKTFDAMSYLALEGDGDSSKLIWTSSDESIATVPTPGTVAFTDFAKDGDTVKITVRYDEPDAKLDPTTLTLKVVYDRKPYTELKFTEEKLSVVGSVNLMNYLTWKGNEYDEDSLVWTSENQQIALVDEDGYVTVQDGAVDGDTVKITVRSKYNKDCEPRTVTLTVKKNVIAIKTITLTQETFELQPNDLIYLGRYIVTDPVDYAGDELIFTSDDPSVVIAENTATYDAALQEDGEAHITVRTAQGAAEPKQFTIKLKAKGADYIAFKDAPKTFYKEMNTLDLRDYLVTKPTDYVKKHSGNLVWESSDPTVALAYNEQDEGDVYGILTYKQPGTVTITVTDKISGESDKVELTLKEKYPVKSITFALQEFNMKVGDTHSLTDFVNIEPAKVDKYDVLSDIKWVSSNRDVAEVQVDDIHRNSTGPVIVAYKAGETTITAYYETEDGTVVKDSCKVTVTEVEVESVEFAAKKYTLKMNTKLNEKVRFNVAPFNASNIDASDVYVMTNNTDVIDVAEPVIKSNGKGYVKVTAKKPGKAWIGIKRTSDDKLLGTVKIVVETVRVKRFKLPKNAITLYWYDDGIPAVPAANATANRTYQNYYELTPVVTPSKANYTVSYETSDPSVAFVRNHSDLEGDPSYNSADIVASGVGKCTITVKVDDGEKVRVSKLKVTVAGKTPKPVIDQKKVTLNMEKGPKSITLNVYDDNTKQALKVTWASSDKKVAKVSKSGKVTAVGAGKATITATHKDTGKTLKCIVTVKAKSTENADKVKKITGDAKVSVKVGEKKTLNIKVKPAGAKVTFKSSDTSIVKVGKDGKIKGVKAGKATITVSGDGVEFKIKVTVKK